MTLAVWYLFLGFPIFVIGSCALIFPAQFKKEVKPLFESTANLKLISVWYYTVGAILLYTGLLNISELAGKVLILISLGLLAHSGITQLFSSYYSEFVLNKLKKSTPLIIRLLGATLALSGIAMMLYAVTNSAFLIPNL
jgi:hypothetical protein